MAELPPMPENETGPRTFTVQEGFGEENAETFTVEEALAPDGQNYTVSFTRNDKTYTGTAPITEPRGTAVINALADLNKDEEKEKSWTVKWDY